jgi:adenine-specific DNA-methyltransferase
MDKLKMHSPDLTQDNVARIRELFPGCVTEAADKNGKLRLAVDFDQLRQELSDHVVDGPQERYHLDWPGKREALIAANAPIAKTLRPSREESVDFSETKNLFIEGDNLEALKLLQEAYLNKVKLVYIDPPYNSGEDFVYEDDFSESAEQYLNKSNQTSESGHRLVLNKQTNGRFHSDWAAMIYSRLRLARSVMREDGTIFVSIDDNEVANLRLIMGEVFGAENFVAEIVWEGANKNDARQIGICHEYVIVFAKDRSKLAREWSSAKEGVEPVLREVARLKALHGNDFEKASEDLAGWFRAMKAKPSFANRRFRYIDERGAYKEDDPTAPGGRRFELINPKNKRAIPLRKNRGWSFDQEQFNKLVSEGRISFISETSVMVRRYLHETDENTPQSVIYQAARSASERLSKLIGEGVFDFPKDELIIQKFVDMATSASGEEEVVLDFFAGSATTAHAVLLQNALDGGNRRFVLVQIPQPTDEKSAAYRAGYKNVAEIAKARLKACGKLISAQTGSHPSWRKDVGFRVLTIDTSNMADVYYSPDAVKQDLLAEQVDNIRYDRTPEDLLFQVLLDWGVDLALPIRQETIAGKTVFFVDDTALAACFDRGVDETFVKTLASYKPLRVVFRDAGFASDSVKINVEQLFKLLSPATEIKTI